MTTNSNATASSTTTATSTANSNATATATPRVAAIAMLAASAFLFALMAAVAKRAAVRLPGAEVALVRFCVSCAACALVALRVRLRARNKMGLFLRGFFGGLAVLGYFLAIEHLPIGVATLLNYSSPVFTGIWAALFLGEPLEAGTVAALALTLVGVVLVIQGDAPAGSFAFSRWHLVGFLSAMLSGAAVAAIREVRKTDGSWEIFTAFSLGGVATTLLPGLHGWVAPAAHEWALLVLVGLLSVLAQIAMTWALRWVRAAVAGILIQLTPVASLALGALVYQDRLSPVSLLGAAIALAGVSWGAVLAARPQPIAVEDP